MQRDREGTNDFVSGSLFDDFGRHNSMMSSIFGGRDPFDDPFFSRPFSSVFGSGIFGSRHSSDDLQHVSGGKGPIIEELGSDDEDEQQKEDDNPNNGAGEEKFQRTRSSKSPIVEHPDDQDEKSKRVLLKSDQGEVDEKQQRSQSVSFRKVTYGGINGAYYTASTTRKSDGDGMVLEESKQADVTTGQATHRISKGMHGKGHSVTRKLNTDGKVDTMQALHNLNEDELSGFEQAWKGNFEKYPPGWREEFNSFGNAGPSDMNAFRLRLPFEDQYGRGAGQRWENNSRADTSRRAKKVVTINIE